MTNFNPTPKSFLMWANKNPKYPNSFIIKTDKQTLLGLVRTDKNGTTYWKFKERVKKEVKNNPEFNPVVDNIQKFQQRQEKAQIKQESYEQPSINATNSEQSN